MKKILLFIAISVLAASCSNTEVRNASALAHRILGAKSSRISFVQTADSIDTFSLESKGRKIVISANNANSMAVGLNYYLKNYCLTTVSWYLADPVQTPKVLPAVPEKISVSARSESRFFLNYCTFGYSLPWFRWKEWERLIDWMALNGVNMPLAITGQEAVWQKVWRSYGMSDDQIRAYFTGPAVLPWHRMMNVDRWLGPLPQKWIDSQAGLQKKILQRERDLNMTPVLSAFSGHIPMDMMELYPNAKILPVSLWDGFDESCRTYILHPDDPMFAEIQKRFLEEQTRMFGTDHIYGLDIFNEVDFFENRPWDPQELSRISHHVYETLTSVDSEAIWLQMGWMMYYDQKHWTPENIEAYLSSVPEGKIIMLDYFCEKQPIYEFTNGFYGQKFIWCFLGNFGGNTNLSGDFKNLGRGIEKAYSDNLPNMTGLGCTLEGFGVSQWLYEYALDKAWNTGMTDRQWLNNLADRHIGCKDEVYEQIWNELAYTVYTIPTYSGICPVAALHPCLEGHWNWTTLPDVPYTLQKISGIYNAMKTLGYDTDWFRFDLATIGSEVIKLELGEERDKLAAFYYERDLEGVKYHIDRMRELYDEWEQVASMHRAYSFDEWVGMARSWGDTDEEKDYYERSARIIPTTWGGNGQLTDYANRQWSGMITDYYRARWESFFEEILSDLSGDGPAFDQKTFDAHCRTLELAFGEPGTK